MRHSINILLQRIDKLNEHLLQCQDTFLTAEMDADIFFAENDIINANLEIQELEADIKLILNHHNDAKNIPQEKPKGSDRKPRESRAKVLKQD